jgi:hypothetical protein
LVDVVIDAAGAWSLTGTVADGLADAVPLDLGVTGSAACGDGGCAEGGCGGGPSMHQIAAPPARREQ